MGRTFAQLCLTERIRIDLLVQAGHSIRRIARLLGRAPSTISRELKRNSKVTKQWPGGYEPERADRLTKRRRRWDARHKLSRQPALQSLVRDRLAMGWSPEQIAGRLALEHGHTVISHESIYRFIYHRSAQKDYWHRLLPQAKHRRGRLGKRGGSKIAFIKERTSIHQRPKAANDRCQPGHWEADLMLFAKYGQAILVAHERTSRFTWITRQPSKAAQPVIDTLTELFARLPKPLRTSITFDNGTEFFLHHKLKARLGIATYFCDPYAPWQKGGVENAILRIRRKLPRKSDLAALSNKQIQQLAEHYNSTPRKCLNYKTPKEIFQASINRVALQT